MRFAEQRVRTRRHAANVLRMHHDGRDHAEQLGFGVAQQFHHLRVDVAEAAVLDQEHADLRLLEELPVGLGRQRGTAWHKRGVSDGQSFGSGGG